MSSNYEKMGTEINDKFVVLFQSDISENDSRYVKIINESGIKAKNISTLSFNFINLEQLRICLQNANDYSGLIFTSTKAVSAVASAFASSTYAEQWKEKLNFSVGQATSKMALSLLNLKTCGETSGSAEKLCEVIVQMYGQCKKPFVFPCSSIRKNTISDTLSQYDIQIKEIVCYETVPNIQFNELWKNLVKKEGFPEILVFFSPSGVQFCSKMVMDSYLNRPKPKCVAIGHSTEKALLEANIVSKVSEKPNPESVLCVVEYLLNV